MAAYGFDNNNHPPATFCNDPNESVVVTPVGPITPTLTTSASQGGPSYTDTATLAGGTSPTGTITFNLFGPNDATCTGAPLFTSTVTVTGNGQHTSAAFTPARARHLPLGGRLQRRLRTTLGVSTACNDPAESFVVAGPPPPVVIVTQASPSVTVGGQLTDTATLTGGTSPTGTVTFVLYGPDDATCSAPPAFTSAKTVTGTGSYTSDPFTTAAPGTYRWRATYSGDADNAGSATGCNDPAETVIVTPVPPSCSGSQSAGSHTVGETFTIVFTPPCGFVSPPPVTKSVNGVPVGSQAATNGTASVTITVIVADDPVRRRPRARDCRLWHEHRHRVRDVGDRPSR